MIPSYFDENAFVMLFLLFSFFKYVFSSILTCHVHWWLLIDSRCRVWSQTVSIILALVVAVVIVIASQMYDGKKMLLGKYYRVKVDIRLIKRSIPLLVISALACM